MRLGTTRHPRLLSLAACTAALALLLILSTAAATALAWWHPPAKPTFYWQLQGRLNTTVPAAIYDLDGFETTATDVASLHAAGKRVVCYVDVGTAESFRPDYSSFPKSVLGRSNGWRGERWLDIRRRTDAIEPIMAARFRMCAEKGFDAVEPDNIEAFSNKSGFSIGPAEQLSFNLWVADTVHRLGMAVLQKNDGEQAAAMEPRFDGVLTEQCNEYSECGDYKPYLRAGKPVIDAEYRLARKRFCAADAAMGITGARFNLALNGRRFEPCW
jgi:hypothetical protein